MDIWPGTDHLVQPPWWAYTEDHGQTHHTDVICSLGSMTRATQKGNKEMSQEKKNIHQKR